MRSYPRNSPQAAARIVALVLIADGHVCRSEIEALDRAGLERELGLPAHGFAAIVQGLCEDLLMGAYAPGLNEALGDELLTSLMADIDSPSLQRAVLRLASAAADADGHLAEGELKVVEAAQGRWGMPVEVGGR